MAKKIKKDVEDKKPTREELAKKALENLNTAMKSIEDKTFKFMFFVMDTKNIPNGSLAYIYHTAKKLSDLGYNVCMLHGEKEFIGVERWMGEDYAKLKHYNIETDGVKITPADFLIIPELYSNVMYQTMKLPCKRIVLLQNRDMMTEIIQPGSSWMDYGIADCITTSKKLAEYAKSVFPILRTSVVRPFVDTKKFTSAPVKKAFVNLVTRSNSETSRIVKEFFWKQPALKWVSFRDIKNLSRDEFAEVLSESFATVWCDEKTDFGVSALEAMAAGNVVIGKVPEDEPEWMFDEKDQLINNGAWFIKTTDANNVLADVIEAFLTDNIPSQIFENAKATAENYSDERFTEDVKYTYIDNFVKARKNELRTAIGIANNSLNNKEEK